MKHKLITELCKKPKSSWTEEEKRKVKDLLDGFKQKGKPIYPYIKKREIYFELVYDNKFFVDYRRYEDAENVWNDLKDGIISIEDLTGSSSGKRKELITLEDGYNRMAEIEKLARDAGEFKNNTFEKYRSDFRLHILPYFKNKPIVKITKGDVLKYVEQIRYRELSGKKGKNGIEKKLSVGTQTEILNLFKRIYRETKRRFDLETTLDIDYEVEMPKQAEKKEKRENKKKVGKILKEDYEKKQKKTLEKVAVIEDGIYNPIFAIDLLIHCTGMRIDEAIALKPSKLKDDKTLLIDANISWHPDKEKTEKSYEETSTKTDSERVLLLADSIYLYLKEYVSRLKKLSYYSDEMYIFSRLNYARTDSVELDPFSLKTYVNHIAMAKKEAGIVDKNGNVEMTKNHIARHAFNSIMKDAGVEQYDREEYLGHFHPAATNMIYTHSSSVQLKKIVKASEKFCRYLTSDIPQFQELIKRK